MEAGALGAGLRLPKSPEGRQQQPGEALGLGIWIPPSPALKKPQKLPKMGARGCS